jgi:hypothetical protein
LARGGPCVGVQGARRPLSEALAAAGYKNHYLAIDRVGHVALHGFAADRGRDVLSVAGEMTIAIDTLNSKHRNSRILDPEAQSN